MSGNQSLIELLQTEVSPNQFENLIADLWTLQDWDTQTTSQNSDKGIDIVATREFPYEEKSLIQAKRYGKRNRVSSPEMQKYASLKQRTGVDSVVVVTTSEFTGEAESIAEDFNLKCIDGEQLIRFIQRLEAEELVREYASKENPSPTVERPSYPGHDSNKVQSEDTTTTNQEFVTASAEGVDVSIDVVALSQGRALNHYLTAEISEVEESMSLVGKKTFERRLVAFVQVTNMGDKVDARSRHLTFETEDGYEYSLADDSVMGVTSGYLQGRWKSAKWEISHGQTQYWAVISEPIPTNIDLEKLIYTKDGERIEIEFGYIRDRLYEQNALAFSS